MNEPGLVIVGASLAGLRSAEVARTYGFSGSITVLGNETEMPYERPELSKRFLTSDASASSLELRRADQAVDQQIEWRLGVNAVGLDLAERRVALDDGAQVPFTKLVIATGARPRRIPAFQKPAGTLTLRSLADARVLKSALAEGMNVVIIGAGFIGCEVAASAVERRCKVTIVEPLATPLVRGLGPELGHHIVDLHRRRGVNVKLGTSVLEVTGDERPAEVVCSDGDRVKADVVLIGVGAEPNVDWLDGSGLDVDNGVVCDRFSLATNPSGADVAAVGDVSRFFHVGYGEHVRLEHWTNATEQAVAAMFNLLHPGEAKEFAPVPFFWTDQYDQKWQLAGRIGPGDRMEVIDGEPQSGSFFALFGNDVAAGSSTDGRHEAPPFASGVTAVLGVNQPRQVMRSMRLITDVTSLTEAAGALRRRE